VRVTDWAVRTLVTVTFFAFFFAPSHWVFPLVLVCFAVVGALGMIYPEGVLGWAKAAHPGIDVDDSSIWWIPRLIGAFFLCSPANARIAASDSQNVIIKMRCHTCCRESSGNRGWRLFASGT
jgi:hypothetical protein